MSRLFRVVVTTVVCGLVVAQAAVAATWSPQRAPVPTSANGALSAISCTGSTCEAVGTDVNAGGNQVTLAERWTGSAWTTQATPNAAGNTFNELTAVSCSAANACTALETSNYAYLFGNTYVYAERWNGSIWSQSKIHLPAGEYGVLNAIACTSATACTAVGSYGPYAGDDKVHPLVEVWNGTSWTARTAPTPAGDTGAFLNGVSCSSGGCLAVGGSVNSSTGNPALAEVFTGAAWAPETPDSSTGAVLDSVSCSAATTCTAVGENSSHTGLGEELSGTQWTAQTVSGTQSLVSLSCSDASDCTAVGAPGPAIERWDGSNWSAQSAATASSPPTFVGISCPAISSCTAVGATGSGFGNSDPWAYQGGEGRTVAEAWSGSSWSLQTTQNRTGAENYSAGGIDCVSGTSDCTAVGSNLDIASQRTLPYAAVDTGSGWARKPVPVSSTVASATLNAVACPVQGSCVAVGAERLGPGNGFYAIWNGTKWTSGAITPPSPGANLVLTSVSCVGTTSSCMAVGIYQDGIVQTMVSETWNGSTWTEHPVSLPAGATSPVLSGVSCSRATSCQAVGSYLSSSYVYTALADHWNSSSWSAENLQLPTGGAQSQLLGVDCTTAAACTAVGSYSGSSPGLLLERFDGTSWTQQPPPSGLYDAYSVSCPTRDACTEVGAGGSTDWSGTNWTAAVPYATPPDGGGGVLSSVSCLAAQTCVGTGASVHALAGALPLIENYS